MKLFLTNFILRPLHLKGINHLAEGDLHHLGEIFLNPNHDKRVTFCMQIDDARKNICSLAGYSQAKHIPAFHRALGMNLDRMVTKGNGLKKTPPSGKAVQYY